VHRERTRENLELLEGFFTRTCAGPEHWALAGRYTLGDVMMPHSDHWRPLTGQW